MSYEIRNITLGYSENQPLLRDFSLDVLSGQLIALVGRNGIGKSTLLRTLAGTARPMAGDVLMDGNSIFSMKSSQLAKYIAFVNTEIITVEHLKVWDVVSFGRSPYTNWAGALSDEDEAIVTQAIRDVGVSHLKSAKINRLSDGERQRVMVARAIAQQTPIILLDEPTAFLDIPNRYQIAMLLHEIACKQNKTVLYSSHDLATAIKLCDAIWVMSPDGVTSGTPPELAANEAYNVMFEGTPLTFDSQYGTITIK